MDRNRHVAIWLRMLAEKEISAARYSKNLLKTQGVKIAAAYAEGGQVAALQAVKQGQGDWARILISVYTKTIKDFAEYLQGELGVKKSKSRFTDLMQMYVGQNAYTKSIYITATTHEIVKNVIAKGIQDGVGESEIAKRLKNHFTEGVADSRARTIARTEVHNAASFGMQTAAEESELRLTREWVAVGDERTRDGHEAADGQQRGMDEPFDVDGEELDYPGDGSPENAINCRCTLIYNPRDQSFAGVDASEGDFTSGVTGDGEF